MRTLIRLAATYALLASLYPSKLLTCDLAQITITNPPDYLVGDLKGAKLRDISYVFDPPKDVTLSGRDRQVSNVTESITADITRLIAENQKAIRQALPSDSCGQIVDDFTISPSSNRNGILRLAAQGNGRVRECTKYDLPCWRGLKTYMCRHTNSVTFASGSFSSIYEVTPKIQDDGAAVEFTVRKISEASDVDLSFATVLFTGVLAPLIEDYMEKEAQRIISNMSVSVVTDISAALPRLEPTLDLDQHYRALRFTDARFEEGGVFRAKRSLPRARDLAVICKMHDYFSQAQAYAREAEEPTVVHTVDGGETLWSIAKQRYGDGRYHLVLIQANPALRKTAVLRQGMTLQLPMMRDLATPPRRGRVVEGRDTLWALAKHRFGDGSKYGNFARLGGSGNPNLIYPLELLSTNADGAPE